MDVCDVSLLFYNSYDIFLNSKNKDKVNLIPGGKAFSSYFEIFHLNSTVVDRTNTITFPLNTKVLDFLKMPDYQKSGKSFEEICDERINFLLMKARHTNKKLAVLYSGGVDSTLILCSILKNAKQNDLNNVHVFMSDDSVKENLNFYYNFIIKKFKCFSSYKFPYILGRDDYLFVSGENADQLYGAGMNLHGIFSQKYSLDELFGDYKDSYEQMLSVLQSRLSPENQKYGEPIFKLFTKLVESAAIDIKNVYQFYWWLTFSLKWQSVYVRILPYSLNKTTLKLEENFTTFYSTKDFSLWALNNFEKFSSDPTSANRDISKQYIFDVNGDKDYLKKPKVLSLHNLVRNKNMVQTIDDDLNYSNEYPNERYYNFENDFLNIERNK